MELDETRRSQKAVGYGIRERDRAGRTGYPAKNHDARNQGYGRQGKLR
jgi:hypothetical protein